MPQPLDVLSVDDPPKPQVRLMAGGRLNQTPELRTGDTVPGSINGTKPREGNVAE